MLLNKTPHSSTHYHRYGHHTMPGTLYATQQVGIWFAAFLSRHNTCSDVAAAALGMASLTAMQHVDGMVHLAHDETSSASLLCKARRVLHP